MSETKMTRLVLIGERFLGGELRESETPIAEIRPLGKFSESDVAKVLYGSELKILNPGKPSEAPREALSRKTG